MKYIKKRNINDILTEDMLKMHSSWDPWVPGGALEPHLEENIGSIIEKGKPKLMKYEKSRYNTRK